jgi:chemotaxis protein histidine kinase CheA
MPPPPPQPQQKQQQQLSPSTSSLHRHRLSQFSYPLETLHHEIKAILDDLEAKSIIISEQDFDAILQDIDTFLRTNLHQARNQAVEKLEDEMRELDSEIADIMTTFPRHRPVTRFNGNGKKLKSRAANEKENSEAGSGQFVPGWVFESVARLATTPPSTSTLSKLTPSTVSHKSRPEPPPTPASPSSPTEYTGLGLFVPLPVHDLPETRRLRREGRVMRQFGHSAEWTWE